MTSIASTATTPFIQETPPPLFLPTFAAISNNVQVIGAAWMLSSALFTTYSTTKFLKFKESATNLGMPSRLPLSRSTLLTLYRFSGSLLLGLVGHPDLHILGRIRETWRLCPTFAWPAVFLFIANYANSISLNRIGISLTYTSKCAIPLVTVLLTVAMDGVQALPSTKILLTLLPIAIGIATASWNHPTFEPLGFVAATVSCAAQSALNVSCKKAMAKGGVSGPIAQRAMVAVGLVVALAYSSIQMAVSSGSNEASLSTLERQPPLGLSAVAVLAYHMEYVLSFSFVKMIAPVSYSACDAVRRLGIIIAGQCMFGGPPFTGLNIVGIGLALLGALGFSILNSS